MSYAGRIEEYFTKPMLIDRLWGLEQWHRFSIAHELNETHFKEVRQAAIEAIKPKFYDLNSNQLHNDSLQQNVAQVVEINLIGPMFARDGLCVLGVDRIISELSKAENDPRVLGILLNTDSGGGEVNAAQKLGNVVSQITKPIYQFVEGISASGAYWVGSYCNEIIMGGQTTEVGSVGVVVDLDVKQIEWLKENRLSIYASNSKNKRKELKLILEGKFDEYRKESLDPVENIFDNLVKTNRKSVNETALKGDMYLAKQAIKMGLADRILTKQDAIKRLARAGRIADNKRKSKKILC